MASSDENDEDLRTAIALSLAESCRSESESRRKNLENAKAGSSINSGMGFLGLDRRAMEEERLARLKRKPEESVTDIRQSVETVPTSITSSSITGISSESLKYPKGVIKKTWAFGHKQTGNEVKLEEVLEAHTLRTALLSAFQWDTNWVFSKLKIPPNGGNTKCIFVMQGKEAAQREAMRKNAKEMHMFLRLCFPPMEGQVNCMHSKLMLLFHPDKLRIALPTANLVSYDWGETGEMENCVFMIDLPRLPNNSKNAPDDLTPFGKELLYFLEKQGLDADVRAGVLNFDFSETVSMAFVHTVGGASFDTDAQRTGLPGLSSAVRTLHLETELLEIDYAASSIGFLNDNFLTNVHSAAQGNDPFAKSETTVSAIRSNFFTPASSRRESSIPQPVAIRDCVRVYFPTHDTVSSSTAGGAGTICLQRNWFESGTFPRSCFRDYRSTREGLLSHNKILCARGQREDINTGRVKDVAWIYVGSANLSESAWGKVFFNKKKGEVKINCRNWECGVVLPVPEDAVLKFRGLKGDKAISENKDEGDLVSMDIFKEVFDLPFCVPGERYGSKKPWYFREQM